MRIKRFELAGASLHPQDDERVRLFPFRFVLGGARELFRERRFFAAPEATHEHEHDDHDPASHTAGISSVVLRSEKLIDIDQLYEWIGELQNNLGPDLLRYKGIIYSDEWPGKRGVLQGVHALYTVIPDREWNSNEKRESTIVIIGQNMDHEAIEGMFRKMTL